MLSSWLLAILLFLFSFSEINGALYYEHKQYLLNLHNKARREASTVPHRKLLTWHKQLAIEAESYSKECSDTSSISPPSQSALIAAVEDKFSWIGANLYIIKSSQPTSFIVDNSTLSNIFNCWLEGNSPCTNINREQILHPDSYLIGCGANVFSSDDRCHFITSGMKVTCFFAPGYVSDGISPQNNDQCPPDAVHIIDGLCSNTTIVPPLPVDPPNSSQLPTTIPNVYRMTPTYGSIAGGTVITLHGVGFSPDQFNNDNPNLGNKVLFYNNRYSNIPCKVEPYYSSEIQIVCTTSPSPDGNEGVYKIQVFIDGNNLVELGGRLCNGDCRFNYVIWATPTIQSITPFAAVPGANISINGRIFTYEVSATQQASNNNWNKQVISRILIGGELCDAWTDDQTTPYGGSVDGRGYGSVSCKPTTNRIDSMNATVILSQYGNSMIVNDGYAISSKLQRYTFQTHAEITGVVPNTGSPSGGTLITIYGNNFNVLYGGDVKAYISGIPCKIVNYTQDTIECITIPAVSSINNTSIYQGGRGLCREVWLGNEYTKNLDQVEARPYGCYDNSSNWSIEEQTLRNSSDPSLFGEKYYFNQRYSGFFVPPIEGLYTFAIVTDDVGRLYFSVNKSREDKELIAYQNYFSSSWKGETSNSRPIYLKAGESYYIEGVHRQGNGRWQFGFGVKAHNLSWTNGIVDFEQQRVNITSTVIKETQEIFFATLPTIQVIKIYTTNETDNNFTYSLSFAGNTTHQLSSSTDNDSSIELALNTLHSIQNLGSVKVQTSNSNRSNDSADYFELVVLFVTNHLNIPLIKVTNYTNIITANTTLWQKLQIPTTFGLSFNTRKTRLMSVHIPPSDLSIELMGLFTTVCQRSGQGRTFFNDSYDVNGIQRNSSHGFLDNSREPFCGRFSLKNPSTLWKRDVTIDERTGLSLDTVTFSRYGYKYVCFARTGFIPYSRLSISVLFGLNSTIYHMPLTTNINRRWNYECLDVFEFLHSSINNPFQAYVIDHIYVETSNSTIEDYWIDEFTISASIQSVIPEQNAARPGGIFVDYVNVTYQDTITPRLYCDDNNDIFSCYLKRCSFTVLFTVHHCGHNMPLLSVTNLVRVIRKSIGSPPVSGTFDLTFEDKVISEIQADSSAVEFKNQLELFLPNKGTFIVSRFGNCYGYSWDVTWSQRGGDLPLMTATNMGNLNGNNVSVSVLPLEDGGTWIRPLRGDMLRLPYQEPQVEAIINGIPSSCKNNNCSFTFTDEGVPHILYVIPTHGGQAGTPITIYGKGFPADSTQITVTIGNRLCRIVTHNETSVSCIPMLNEAGPQLIRALIDGIGYSIGEVSFEYSLSVTSIEPSQGSLGGHNIVTITGTGFSRHIKFYAKGYQVLIGGNPCRILTSNFTTLTCLPTSHSPESVNITVIVNKVTTVITNGYTYSIDSTAIIDSITPSFGPSSGGTTLYITGRNFVNTTDISVVIGGVVCSIVSVNTTSIECETGPNSPGGYDVIITSWATFGQAVHSIVLSQILSGNYSTIPLTLYTYEFEVSSITPLSGSLFGGTVLTIDGAGFNGPVVVLDSRGNELCTHTDITYNRIICQTKSTSKHYVIQNNGINDILGKYFAWNPAILEITVGDTVTWKWNGSQAIPPQKFEVHSNDFSSVSSVVGNYSHRYIQPGIYRYTTYVDSLCLSCDMSGIIIVRDLKERIMNVKVQLNNSKIEAIYNMTNINIGSNQCLRSSIGSKLDNKPGVFVYSTCSTPVVNYINVQNSTLDSNITLIGTGFTTGNVSILIGGYECVILEATDSVLVCKLNISSEPPPFVSLHLSLFVHGAGYAFLNTSMIELTFIPKVTDIVPSTGSIFGGNTVFIQGTSLFFGGTVRVYLGKKKCFIKSITYDQIEVIIPPARIRNSNSMERFNITYGSQSNNVLCEGDDCYYHYSIENTPQVIAVDPIEISDYSIMTITGRLLEYNSIVKIGHHNCSNITKIDSGNITCTIYPIRASIYPLTILVPRYGYAIFDDNNQHTLNITSQLIINSFHPLAGSIRGGLALTLNGHGYCQNDCTTTVTIGGKPCNVLTSNYSTLQCRVPDLNQEGNYSIILSIISSTHQVILTNFTEQTFAYSLTETPHITSITPTIGQFGDTVLISGSGLSIDAIVRIGGASCNVSMGNDTNIICTLGVNFVGSYRVNVFIPSKGRANGQLSFQYDLIVDDIFPVQGSFSGHNTLTIKGLGFNPVTTFVTVCDRICPPVYRPTLRSIQCVIPSLSHLLNTAIDNINCTVTLRSVGSTVSLSQYYTLRRDLTPFLFSINRTRGGTAGGSLLQLNGTGFTNNVTVTIAGTLCNVREYTESIIVCETGAGGRTIQAPVMVYIEGKGYAVSTAEDFYYVDLWSSPYTWGGKGLPRERDFVIVPAGQTLVLDIRTPILSILLIQGGQLIFDDVKDGIELHSENILITDGGRLQIGTEQTPYQHKAQIVMYGNRVSTELPLFGAKTLSVRNGTLDLHGKPIMNTWTCLSSTVRAGERVLVVKHDVSDWEMGGLIVIATTSFSRRENEELTIESISNDGRSITVTTPLNYTHISMTQTIHGKVIETCAEVGLLTRNVVVRGNRNDEWDRNFKNCSDNFNPGQFARQTCFNGRFGTETIGDQFGSQIMFHKGPRDNVVGRLSYIEVTNAGQAFRLGRYPIHFHLNGDVNGSYVRGCGIHHTFNRAVSLYGVDNLVVEKNVVYDILGQAYYIEKGEGNILQYNLGIFVRGSSSLLNEDITPAIFWVLNPNNILRHNAAAGGTHFGFWYRLYNNRLPLGGFYNNTAHSLGRYGMWVYPSYYPVRPDICNKVTPAVFKNFLAWRNSRGVEFFNVGAVQLKDSILLDNIIAGVECTKVTSTWGKNGSLIEDVLIVAHSELRYTDNDDIGVCTSAGIKTPHSYYLTVSNVTFVNFNESDCYALQACSHCRTKQGGFETRFEKLVFDNSPRIAAWKWEHEQVYRDMDGTLTGTPGGSLLPSTSILPAGNCSHHEGSSFGTINGSVCDETITFARFSLARPIPSSLTYRTLLLISQNGVLDLDYVQRRLLLGPGYMGIIPTQQVYQLDWAGGDSFTNISYITLYSGMTWNDYIWISHDFNKTIDIFKINNVVKNSTTFLPPGGASQLGDRYISENNSQITYYVNGSRPTCPVNFRVTFASYLCYYEDCIEPPPPEPPTPLVPGRPNVTYYWSDTSIWSNGQLPVDGSDVVITLYILVDIQLPRFNTLTIHGGLEFVDDRDHLLEAQRILIDGGQLVAGTADDPFEHQLDIVLLGDMSSQEYRLPNFGPVLGAKALGVFGHLSLHGQVRLITWTRLIKTANVGDTQIYVREPVNDWKPGDEIVIASTSFEARQAEEHTIANISNDGLIITITQPLTYKHLGGEYNTGECSVNISAEVGLLTRNIKILGTSPNATTDVAKQQSYGCRVLVSTYYNRTLLLPMIGSAKLSGVEFKGCGQEGYEEPFDPKYSLSFLSTGTIQDNSSYIKSCSFHNGYSTGIGIFGANNMIISNNVVHRTVGPSFYITGNNHVLEGNLAVVALFPGTYRVPEEPLNDKWTANYELVGTSNLLLIGNSAAGGAKAGFHTNGENCIESNFTPLWRDNTAHSTLHGIHVGYTDGHTKGDQIGCSAFHKFTVYSCYHYGMMAYSKAGILITNSTFVNNFAATFTAVIGPAALSHVASNKSVIIRDTMIVSSIHQDGSVNCTEYNYKPIIAYHSRSHSPAIQSPWKGHVGVILTSFTSGSGGFPKFKWTVKHSYPAISGLTKLINVKFCNFGTHCSTLKEVALMTDPSSEDAQHPVWTEQVSYLMGSNSSKFYNHNPLLSSINPADCVDMDCDGLKKILIRDIDGSFTGTDQGLASLISRSEYEWNGDRRRGLGDYRIPIAMLSRADGSRIDINSIYPNKGIYRGKNESCQWMSEWNSYHCTDIDHMMLIIESLDADTEVRRLSPIGVGADKYIDLINGPQDHGYCGGYTCQERISTFYAIVSTGLNYTIGLTSTNPQRTNFILLNANESQSLMIAYIYNNPQRLDVYVGSDYIIPTNGYMKNGNLRYRRGSNFIPSPLTDPHGTNYYDRSVKKLYIVIQGGSPVRVETTQVIQLGYRLPPVTIDEFFETNLVRNLARLLGISSNRIRIVEVISEGGGTGRKRQTTGSTTVNIEIGDVPSNDSESYYNMTATGPTTEENDTYNDLLNITSVFSIVVQTGMLSSGIGYPVQDVIISEPRPIVSDPGEKATNVTGGPQPGDNGTNTLKTFAEKQFEEEQKKENSTEAIPLYIPIRLSLITQPSQGIEGIPLNEVTLRMYDASGNIVPYLGVVLPWLLTVTASPNVVFTNGTNSIGNGEVTFTDLIFDRTGDYQISYQITYPSSVDFNVASTISIQRRDLYALITTQPPLEANNTHPIRTSIQVMDSIINTIATNLGWRGREWFVKATAISSSFNQDLGSARIIQGKAQFSDVYIERKGTYIIRFSVYTTPTSPSNELPPLIDSNQVTITQFPFTRFIVQYSGSYSSIVKGYETLFMDSLKAHIESIDPSVFIYKVMVWEGSIMTSFFASAQDENTLTTFSNNLQSPSSNLLQFTFRNYNLNLESVQQDPNYPITTSSNNNEVSTATIIAIVLSVIIVIGVAIIVLVAIILAFCYKKHDSKHIKVRRITVKPIYETNLIYSNYPHDDDENEWEDTSFNNRLITTGPWDFPQTPPPRYERGEWFEFRQRSVGGGRKTASSSASTQLTSFSSSSSSFDTRSIVSHPHSATSRDKSHY